MYSFTVLIFFESFYNMNCLLNLFVCMLLCLILLVVLCVYPFLDERMNEIVCFGTIISEVE